MLDANCPLIKHLPSYLAKSTLELLFRANNSFKKISERFKKKSSISEKSTLNSAKTPLKYTKTGQIRAILAQNRPISRIIGPKWAAKGVYSRPKCSY